MLLTIGQMAKLLNITTQTLRHYDKIGLLKPMGVNKENGYRLYTLDQLDTMNTIQFLKYTGMQLEEIKSFLHNQTANEMLKILESQSIKLQEEIQNLEKVNEEIQFKTNTLRNYLTQTNPIEVQIKNIPERYFLKLEVENHQIDNSYMVYVNQLMKEHKHHGVTFSDTGLILPKENLLKQAYSTYKYLFISVPANFSSAIKIPSNKYATIKHIGDYDKCHKSFSKLMDFIQKNNCTIIGDAIEYCIIDLCLTQNRDDLVTELQIPIKTS